MEKTPLNNHPIRAISTAVKSALDVDQVVCANCRFVHVNADLTSACWKNPPTPIGAFVQTRTGAMEVQTASLRAPVERDAWCGEFSRKASA